MRVEHDKLQEEYAQQELLGGAASLGLQKGVDDLAIATNQKYMDETKKAADELATKGFIDSGRRRSLMNLKQQYNQNVLPIQNALKERDAAIKIDREMKMKDQTYESKFDPSKVSVTDYLTNNQAFISKGISKGKMYEDAARDFTQLQRNVNQKYPELVKTGITGKLWTVVNSGATSEEIAGFITNEAKNKNIDINKLSSLGQEMHNIVENNLTKHGAYDVFGDNPNKIQELRTGVANAAIYALNEPKFGGMDDPMALYRAQKTMEQPQNPPGGRGDYDYVPGFDDSGIESVGKVKSNIDKSIKQINYTKSQIDKIARNRPWNEMSAADKSAIKVLYKEKDKASNSLFEIKSELESLGVEIPKELSRSNLEDPKLISFLNKAIPQAEENYKFANKSILFRDLGDKEVDKIQSYIYSNSDNLKSVSGKKVKFDQVTDNGRIIGAPKYILNKHGFNIALNKKDGGQEIVEGNINDLGSPTIAAYYKGVMQVEKDKIEMSDKDFKSVYKVNKSELDLTPNYNALESDIRGRTNTYIATVPIPGQ